MSYHRPTDLAAALRIASEPERTVIAGGTDVFPAMRQGQQPKVMLDITAIPEMSQISKNDGIWRIGAAVRWTDIVRADFPPAFDALKQAARQVGSIQIQNSATLVGNLCNASPAADGVPPLLVLNAVVELSSQSCGTRHIPLAEFIQGPRNTVLEPDELLTAVLVADPQAGTTSHFEKLGSRSYMVISIAMVAATLRLDDRGRIAEARIAVGACSGVAQRLPALETDCVGKDVEALEVTQQHLAPLAPIDDVRGTAAYRLDAVATLCNRALRRAGGR